MAPICKTPPAPQIQKVAKKPDFGEGHAAEDEDDDGGLVLRLGEDVRGEPLQFLRTGFEVVVLDETGFDRFSGLVERATEVAGVHIQIRIPTRFSSLKPLESSQRTAFSIGAPEILITFTSRNFSF